MKTLRYSKVDVSSVKDCRKFLMSLDGICLGTDSRKGKFFQYLMSLSPREFPHGFVYLCISFSNCFGILWTRSNWPASEINSLSLLSLYLAMKRSSYLSLCHITMSRRNLSLGHTFKLRMELRWYVSTHPVRF